MRDDHQRRAVGDDGVAAVRPREVAQKRMRCSMWAGLSDAASIAPEGVGVKENGGRRPTEDWGARVALTRARFKRTIAAAGGEVAHRFHGGPA